MGEEHRVMHKNLSKFPWRANGPNGPHGNEINLELKWPIIWISLLRFTSFVSITDLRLINTAMMPLKVGIYFEQILDIQPNLRVHLVAYERFSLLLANNRSVPNLLLMLFY